jgi:hypothetical protein
MTDRLHNEIEHILANLENKQGNERPEQEPDTTTSPGEVTEIIEETIEVYFIPKARDAARIIDSRAPTQEDPSASFSDDPQAVQEDEERQKLAAPQQQRTVDTLGYCTGSKKLDTNLRERSQSMADWSACWVNHCCSNSAGVR